MPCRRVPQQLISIIFCTSMWCFATTLGFEGRRVMPWATYLRWSGEARSRVVKDCRKLGSEARYSKNQIVDVIFLNTWWLAKSKKWRFTCGNFLACENFRLRHEQLVLCHSVSSAYEGVCDNIISSKTNLRREERLHLHGKSPHGTEKLVKKCLKRKMSVLAPLYCLLPPSNLRARHFNIP